MEKKPLVKSKFELALYIFVILLVVLRFYGAYQESKQRRSALLDPSPAPDFVWRDFDSDKHKLSDLKGKVIVLHFWASWCGPCRSEFPALLRAADKLKNDAVFLTISGDDDDPAAKKFSLTAKSAAGVAPDNVLYGFDPMKYIIFDIFQTIAFPETFIIDPQMRMRRKLAGMQQWNDENLIQYIRDLKTTAAPTNVLEVPKAP